MGNTYTTAAQGQAPLANAAILSADGGDGNQENTDNEAVLHWQLLQDPCYHFELNRLACCCIWALQRCTGRGAGGAQHLVSAEMVCVPIHAELGNRTLAPAVCAPTKALESSSGELMPMLAVAFAFFQNKASQTLHAAGSPSLESQNKCRCCSGVPSGLMAGCA